MSETLRYIVAVALLFGGSVLISYCVTWYIASKRHDVELEVNTAVRLVGLGGTYRCHFLRRENDRLVFSSPIQANSYVPLRPGEKLLVHAAGEDHLMAFRSVLLDRDPVTHEIFLELPHYVRRIDRRTEARSMKQTGQDALINGDIATIVDLSAAGLCLVTRKRPAPGDRVHVVLPESDLDTYGWALEATRAAFGIHAGFKVRVQFEEPLSSLASKV